MNNLVQLNFHVCDSPREVIEVLVIFLCFSARFSYRAEVTWQVSDQQ